jgi:hypothetical protein
MGNIFQTLEYISIYPHVLRSPIVDVLVKKALRSWSLVEAIWGNLIEN